MISTISKSLFKCLVGGLLLWPCTSPARADDSPFSSKEEKNAVLMTAGVDGLIDPWEWEANLRQGNHFADISWDHLSLSDIDGDGRISVNEFYQYYKERIDSLSGKVENTPDEDPLFFDAKPARPVYLDSFILELTDAETMDHRALFKRAHIARRLKFSALSDPELVFQVNKKRSDRLKNIRYRRRLVLDRKPENLEEGPPAMPDIYRSKLVTDRFSRIPTKDPVPVATAPQAGSAMTQPPADWTPAEGAMKDRGDQPLNALGEVQNMPQLDTASIPVTIEPAPVSEEPQPEAKPEKPVKAQNVSSLRGLIPKKEEPPKAETPKKEPKDKKARKKQDPDKNNASQKKDKPEGKNVIAEKKKDEAAPSDKTVKK